MRDTANSTKVPGWLIPALWILLGFLLLALIGVAGFLLVKTDFFSGKSPTDTQAKTLWAFVGVALGAVVTLIGALLTEQQNRRTIALEREKAELTEQHNRRTIALETEAAQREREAAQRDALAKAAQEALEAQAEKRLTLDTVARLLELLTEDGDYAKRARVGGAIATMVELEGGTVALRILGELWTAGAVDTETAVWLIERVLNEDRPEDEQVLAANLLATHVTKLVPARNDQDQDWNLWPALTVTWPSSLPSAARGALLVTAVRTLLAREPNWWHERGAEPVDMFFGALEDDEYRQPSSCVIVTLVDLEFLILEAERAEQIREWSTSKTSMAWFSQLISRFEHWAEGQPVDVSHAPPPDLSGSP
jgi:hypothetical protein